MQVQLLPAVGEAGSHVRRPLRKPLGAIGLLAIYPDAHAVPSQVGVVADAVGSRGRGQQQERGEEAACNPGEALVANPPRQHAASGLPCQRPQALRERGRERLLGFRESQFETAEQRAAVAAGREVAEYGFILALGALGPRRIKPRDMTASDFVVGDLLQPVRQRRRQGQGGAAQGHRDLVCQLTAGASWAQAHASLEAVRAEGLLMGVRPRPAANDAEAEAFHHEGTGSKG